MDYSALRDKFEIQLSKYVPEGSAGILASWVIELNFDLVISHERKSKFGDYRHAYGGKKPRISVNHNLNPYAFLVTLVHEIAHLTSFKKHGLQIKPHGIEWKQEFRLAMRPFLIRKIFPAILENALEGYLQNPAASTCIDDELFRALKTFDDKHHPYVHVETLPEGSIFMVPGGRFFIKGPKRRKRFDCREQLSGTSYLFSPVAEVIPHEKFNYSNKMQLTDLAMGNVFFDNGGKAFRKMESFGTGFRCLELSSGKAYLFRADTEITPNET